MCGCQSASISASSRIVLPLARPHLLGDTLLMEKPVWSEGNLQQMIPRASSDAWEMVSLSYKLYLGWIPFSPKVPTIRKGPPEVKATSAVSPSKIGRLRSSRILSHPIKPARSAANRRSTASGFVTPGGREARSMGIFWACLELTSSCMPKNTRRFSHVSVYCLFRNSPTLSSVRNSLRNDRKVPSTIARSHSTHLNSGNIFDEVGLKSRKTSDILWISGESFS